MAVLEILCALDKSATECPLKCKFTIFLLKSASYFLLSSWSVSHFLVNKLRGDDVEISKAFGIILRKHRKAANLSQEQLALQCDLDRTYIGMLERAERQPSLTTIFTVCGVLKIEPNELIKEVELTIGKNSHKHE